MTHSFSGERRDTIPQVAMDVKVLMENASPLLVFSIDEIRTHGLFN